MKKLLLFILLLSVSFITSCSQDDTILDISNKEKENYSKEIISFKEFLNIEKNNSEVHKLNKYLPEKLKKTNYLNDIDWEIDTTKVIKITTENIITYTFSVNEKSQIEGFRNIIVKKENNQTTNYIVHYPHGVDFEGKSSRQVFINKIESNLFSKKNECYVVVLVPVYGCSTGECVVGEWYLKPVECKTDNDGSDNGGGNPPVNNGSEWDPEDGISLPTDPIGGGGGNGSSPYSLNTIHISSYIYLSDFEKQWLTDNPSITDILLQLLKLNNYSSQSINQISWAKSYLTSNYDAREYFSKNPQDLDVIFYTDVDFSNADDVDFINTSTNTIVDLLINNKNNTLSNLDCSWPNLDDLKQKVKNAISKGIYTTAKYTRDYLYIPMVKVGKKYPSTIYWSNKGIDKIRLETVAPMVNFNENTMSWSDLFNIWLFELTPNKYANNIINFTNSSNIINGNNIYNPSTNAVKNFPKGDWKDTSVNPPLLVPYLDKLKSSLQNGTLTTGSTLSGYFNYNTNAFYATVFQQQNLGIQMLGSFPITGKVLSKTSHSAIIQFTISNDLGWESGTRFIKGQNGGGNQGVIDNKDVGDGLHLGGTITNIFIWTETVEF